MQIPIHHTPAEHNLEKTIIGPAGGWKANSTYLVQVATNKNNPSHRAILLTGFVSKDGQPLEGYTKICGVNHDEGKPHHYHYIEVEALLHEGTFEWEQKTDALELLVSELKSECNRYANGKCTTSACLKRGGYNGGKPDYEKATCRRHEQVTALEALISAKEKSAKENP